MDNTFVTCINIPHLSVNWMLFVCRLETTWMSLGCHWGVTWVLLGCHLCVTGCHLSVSWVLCDFRHSVSLPGGSIWQFLILTKQALWKVSCRVKTVHIYQTWDLVYMFAKLLITTFVIDRTSKLSTHAPKAFQVNCCLFKLGTWKFQRNFCFKSTGACSLRGAPDIRALIKKFPEIELKK